MTLLIDNYDSFSYNLYQLIGELDPDIKVIRNDECTVNEIADMEPARIVISPGPGRPENAGVSVEVIQKLGTRVPILGVCLGHQAVCIAFGGVVTYAKRLMHGKQSVVTLSGNSTIFEGLPERIIVARYHSLIADAETLPETLKITAVTDEGEVMAVQHSEFPIYGLQFHPESIMTPDGKTILKNFIRLKGANNND